MISYKEIRVLAATILGFAFAQLSSGQSAGPASSRPEYRAFWVDAFHSGFTNREEIARLVADCRRINANSLFVEVRRRGDAYYNSAYEPKSPEISQAFDPLAELIANAHDTNGGPRIDVHAWMAIYPVWRDKDQPPRQKNHPFSRHPEWLSQDVAGTNFDGVEYSLDPGHPEVQKHLFNVAMDVLSRYDIDGLNLDYLHYEGPAWGYNPVSVSRFNRLYHRTGRPDPLDARWGDFRRDQVTGLLRKTYINALAFKPLVKVSVGTLTYHPAPTNDAQWMVSRPYSTAFQDWRGWMEEGIMDINIPMAYFRQYDRSQARSFIRWTQFALGRGFGRHVIMSPAIYLNSVADSFRQIDLIRQPTESGGFADGVALYSYASLTSDNIARETVLDSFVHPGNLLPTRTPVFATASTLPEMPWKQHPTTGAIGGFIYEANKRAAIDGAEIVLSGPVRRKMKSDATGFYGAVGLPAGDYTLAVSTMDRQEATARAAIAVGSVSKCDLELNR